MRPIPLPIDTGTGPRCLKRLGFQASQQLRALLNRVRAGRSDLRNLHRPSPPSTSRSRRPIAGKEGPMLRISYGFHARVNDFYSVNEILFKYGKGIFMLGSPLSDLVQASN